MRKLIVFAASVLSGVALAIPMVQPALAASSFQWASQAYTGGNTDDLNNGIDQRGLSDDGRYMVFSSGATNVVPNDTNGIRDIFVRDIQAGTNQLVTQSTSGVQADNDSYTGSISGNGRYVVFSSRANNLASGAGSSNAQKVYLRDLQNNTTTLICMDIYGSDCDSPEVSRDGRYVLYRMYEIFNNYQYFRYDRTTGARERVSQSQNGVIANGLSVSRADMSGDGRYVLFTSTATNLVSNDTNGKVDAFKRDMQTGAVTRVTTSASGAQADGDTEFSSISDNGRYVTFVSNATNLIGTTSGQYGYIKDTATGSIGFISGTARPIEGYITGNGLYVVFVTDGALTASDTNASADVYIWNRALNVNTRVTEDSAGNNLPESYITSWQTGFATPDGRYVPLVTIDPVDSNDVNDGNDVYVADMGAGFPDTTRPTVTFTSPSSFAGPFATGPLVSVSASDAGSGLAVLVIHVYNSSNQLLTTCGSANATQLAAGSFSCSLSSLPAGNYSIKAGATDNAGNNRTILSGTFTIE